MTELSPAAREIIAGRHADPFAYLGPHTENDETVVRVFLPDADRVVAVGERGERELQRIDPAGLFAGTVDGLQRYRLRARFGDNEVELEDPYRFPPVLSDYRPLSAGRRQASAAVRQARRPFDGAGRR